jgi:ribosomal protein S18 acetylase RimI-like enzyme
VLFRSSNIAYADNWGYVPVDKGVLQEMIHKLKPLIDPDAIWFVEDNGNPVGYCLGFPDLNVVLRKIEDRLFPFGFISLLAGIPKITNYRLFGLALLPEYHGMGLDVLLYVTLYKALSARKIRLEANYILEDNLMIRNALEKLALEHVKTYRVFEKPLT